MFFFNKHGSNLHILSEFIIIRFLCGLICVIIHLHRFVMMGVFANSFNLMVLLETWN